VGSPPSARRRTLSVSGGFHVTGGKRAADARHGEQLCGRCQQHNAANWPGPMNVRTLLSGTVVAVMVIGGLVLYTDVMVGMVRWFSCGPWAPFPQEARQTRGCR